METARRGFFSPRLSVPSHLPSRTMKRFRDNRPSDSEVYRKSDPGAKLGCPCVLTHSASPTEHTLGLLYSAQNRPSASLNDQRQQLQHPLHVAKPSAHAEYRAQSRNGGQQRSLHSFWNLPAPAPTASTSSLASSPASSASSSPYPAFAPRSAPTHCEDCGTELGGGEDDAMMDIDGGGLGAQAHACGACGKAVCFSCSISNLGEHRRCLACAGPRGWAG